MELEVTGTKSECDFVRELFRDMVVDSNGLCEFAATDSQQTKRGNLVFRCSIEVYPTKIALVNKTMKSELKSVTPNE